MLSECIDKIISLAPTNLNVIDGLQYADRNLVPVQPPQPKPVELKTLTGLVGLIKGRLDGLQPADYMLHVQAHNRVALVEKQCDAWGRREVKLLATAEDLKTIAFGQFTPAEDFIITLQATFLPSADLNYVVGIASNLTTKAEIGAVDDGLSQTATVKNGLVLQSSVTVRPKVVLSPYRTFREIEQPSSEFVFRLKSGNLCALFEADGQKWKLDAMLLIQAWLQTAELGIEVVA